MPKPFLLRRPSGLYARFLPPADIRAKTGTRYLVRPPALDRRHRAPVGRSHGLCFGAGDTKYPMRRRGLGYKKSA